MAVERNSGPVVAHGGSGVGMGDTPKRKAPAMPGAPLWRKALPSGGGAAEGRPGGLREAPDPRPGAPQGASGPGSAPRGALEALRPAEAPAPGQQRAPREGRPQSSGMGPQDSMGWPSESITVPPMRAAMACASARGHE